MLLKRWDTCLFVFFQFLVVYLADLSKFCPVVAVLDSIVSLSRSCRCSRGRGGCCTSAATFLGSCYPLSDEHVIQPHQLRIRWLFFLRISQAQHCKNRERSTRSEIDSKKIETHRKKEPSIWGGYDDTNKWLIQDKKTTSHTHSFAPPTPTICQLKMTETALLISTCFQHSLLSHFILSFLLWPILLLLLLFFISI